MHEVDLRRVDLNLLVTLQALLKERSVTQAAVRLGMSQPAVSRALQRLRTVFADVLLVESRKGYVLSARADKLKPMLRSILGDIGQMLEASPFNPAAATGSVRLLMPDLASAALASPLLARLTAEAPALNLDILHLELGHVVVSITGVGTTPIDEALTRIGHQRRVQVRVPSFLAPVEIAAQSDLVTSLPSSLARTAAAVGRFVVRPPPLDLGGFTMSLLWHGRHQDDARHVWLRGALVETAKALKIR